MIGAEHDDRLVGAAARLAEAVRSDLAGKYVAGVRQDERDRLRDAHRHSVGQETLDRGFELGSVGRIKTAGLGRRSHVLTGAQRSTAVTSPERECPECDGAGLETEAPRVAKRTVHGFLRIS